MGRSQRPIDCSYILPLRFSDLRTAGETVGELMDYLSRVATWCAEVIVVDGSPEPVFAAITQGLPASVHHIRPDPRHTALMGKVPGVLTGFDLASHEAVVIADDDVRYREEEIARVVGLLDEYALVRPQ